MKLEFVESLVKGKKGLWNFVFPKKVLGRKTTLAGIGESALKIKLETSKAYPHLDVSAFLNWEHYEDFTAEEKELVQALLNELDSSSS